MSYGQTNGVLFPGPFAWMFAWWIMDRWADEQTSAAKRVSCEEFVQLFRKKREIAWKKTRTTSTKSDQQVVPKQGYPKLLKLFHNCLYRADFGGPLYLPFVFFSLSRLGRGTGG